MGPSARGIDGCGRKGSQQRWLGGAAVTHLHRHLQGPIRRGHGDPIHRSHAAFRAGRLAPGGHHHPVHGRIQPHHMQGLTPGHPQPLALANREVLDAIVLAHHRAIAQHNFPLARRQIGIQKRLHRAVVIG